MANAPTVYILQSTVIQAVRCTKYAVNILAGKPD